MLDGRADNVRGRIDGLGREAFVERERPVEAVDDDACAGGEAVARVGVIAFGVEVVGWGGVDGEDEEDEEDEE